MKMRMRMKIHRQVRYGPRDTSQTFQNGACGAVPRTGGLPLPDVGGGESSASVFRRVDRIVRVGM